MGLACFNKFSLYLAILSLCCLSFIIAFNFFLIHLSNFIFVHVFAGDQVRYVGSAKKDAAKHR